MANKSLDQFDDIPVLDPLDWLYIYDRETGKSYKVQAGALAALAGPVASVNSKTGAVTLSTDDLSDAGKINQFVSQAEKDKIAKIETAGDGTKVLANNGQYIIVSASGGGGIIAPVADLTTLKNIDTTSEADYPDKWVIYVESLKVFYAMDRESIATADDDLVVAPVAGPGRWIRNTLPLATADKPGLARAGDPAKIDGAASKLTTFISGNFMAVNSVGDIDDSGKKPTDFIDVSSITAPPLNEKKLLVLNDQKVAEGGGLLIDKLRSDLLTGLNGATYDADNISIIGGAAGSNANLNGEYGYNGTEVVGKRRSYICISHNADTATWKRYTENVHLNATDDSTLIGELESETNWSAGNTKTVAEASVQGDIFVSTTTNYTYFCYDGVNKGWRRVIDTPNSIELYITDTNLKAGIDAHDFALTPVYDASGLAGEKGSQGQKYYNETNNTFFECFAAAKWIKIR
jgi:hypothetical protein